MKKYLEILLCLSFFFLGICMENFAQPEEESIMHKVRIDTIIDNTKATEQVPGRKKIDAPRKGLDEKDDQGNIHFATSNSPFLMKSYDSFSDTYGRVYLNIQSIKKIEELEIQWEEGAPFIDTVLKDKDILKTENGFITSVSNFYKVASSPQRKIWVKGKLSNGKSFDQEIIINVTKS